MHCVWISPRSLAHPGRYSDTPNPARDARRVVASSCDLLGSEGFNSYEFDYIGMGWTPLLRQSAVATPAVE